MERAGLSLSRNHQEIHFVDESATNDSRRALDPRSPVREAHVAAGLTTWSWGGARECFTWGDEACEVLTPGPQGMPDRLLTLWRRVHPSDRSQLRRAMREARASGGPVAVRFRLVGDGGHLTWVRGHGDRVIDVRGRAVRWCGTLQLDNAFAGDSAIISHAAVDDLTGIATLDSLHRQVTQAIARARRGGWLIAVAYLDLERFGRINDEHGHVFGDRVLQQVARRLLTALRDTDSVGRVPSLPHEATRGVASRAGGDKFVVLVEGLDDPRQAGRVIHRITRTIEEPMVVDGQSVSVSALIGISVFPGDGDDVSGLLRHAEGALRARDARPHSPKVRFFSQTIAEQDRREGELERFLRDSIASDSFAIAYQPKVSLPHAAPIGFEALLRVTHPRLGPLPPPSVIELAERTGLITDLGTAIFRRVCRDSLMLRQETGLALRLFTNFSPKQIGAREWSEMITRVIRETGADPSLLGIEITESVFVEDHVPLVRALQEFAAAGVEISLDDFGSGYSNLGYLTRLPIHELKIDQTFVQSMADDHASSREIVGLVVLLGRTLNIRIIAEGAETAKQVEFLEAVGCHAVQGYYFARPAALPTFLDDLRKGKMQPAGDVVSPERA